MGRSNYSALVVRHNIRRQTSSYARLPHGHAIRHHDDAEPKLRSTAFAGLGMRAPLHRYQSRSQYSLTSRARCFPGDSIFSSVGQCWVYSRDGSAGCLLAWCFSCHSIHARRRNSSAGERRLRCSITMESYKSMALLRRQTIPSQVANGCLLTKLAWIVWRSVGDGDEDRKIQKSHFRRCWESGAS